jgi:hypothetical protein
MEGFRGQSEERVGSDRGSAATETPQTGHGRRSTRLWYLLLLVPFAGLLWVPIYADAKPELFGFPFFYWYQFAWVPATALITWIVYRMVR